MMNYRVERAVRYDFQGESYASKLPNLHKYPATMLPQMGMGLLDEFNIRSGRLLDPYCGSGSSLMAGLTCGLESLHGFDLNPLAALISKVRLTHISEERLVKAKRQLREDIYEFIKDETRLQHLPLPSITNMAYWFSPEVAKLLNVLRIRIQKIELPPAIRDFFLLAFSETVRLCSFTRKNEFKLYRMKEDEVCCFNPDVLGVYFSRLQHMMDVYVHLYLPRLTQNVDARIHATPYVGDQGYGYDVVLTSPPYGDSRTTVAYGQFSTLANEWMGVAAARQVDKKTMGGSKATKLYQKGVMEAPILALASEKQARALEVSAFYHDLEASIHTVAKHVKKGGKVIYVVGNRTVGGITMPTDQFIAEQFEVAGLEHLVTYERLLSNKTMPSKNSPSNKKGRTMSTMLSEYIVVLEKHTPCSLA